VANANDRYSYEELLYVRKTYFLPEALRNANGAVVNKLLALRNPRIWGEGASSCASDGSRFESWKQNLMTEWRSRYKGYGVISLLATSRPTPSASTHKTRAFPIPRLQR
jgi:TnpA family transposase